MRRAWEQIPRPLHCPIALIDGLWLVWCLDPDNFEPGEAVELCEAWVERLEGK